MIGETVRRTVRDAVDPWLRRSPNACGSTPEWAEPITWVAAEKIRAAARLFARTKPALLDWGCAIEHRNASDHPRRLVLPALTGNIDVPGGWVFGVKGSAASGLIEDLTPEANAKRLAPTNIARRGGRRFAGRPYPDILKAMRGKPSVKAFLVFGNNAHDLCQHPMSTMR